LDTKPAQAIYGFKIDQIIKR